MIYDYALRTETENLREHAASSFQSTKSAHGCRLCSLLLRTESASLHYQTKSANRMQHRIKLKAASKKQGIFIIDTDAYRYQPADRFDSDSFGWQR